MKNFMQKAFFAITVMGTCLAASAGVSTISNRSEFNSSGTISENNNFSDFGPGFNYPGDPFVRGNVTYTSATNLTVGSGTGYSIGNMQTVMSNNWWSPLTGTISNEFNLLGFDAAVTSGPVNITVSTNLATYNFDGLTLPNGSSAFAFEGFETTVAGEYFTQFRIDTLGGGYLPGITNVALGTIVSTSVPEPETYSLMIAGMGLLGVMVRRRKSRVTQA